MRARDRIASLAEGVWIAVDALRANKVRAALTILGIAIGVPGMVIRNSTFRNCAVMDVFFTYGDWWSPLPPPYGHIRLENNIFGHVMNEDGSWNYYPLYVASTGDATLDSWVVRNNTFEQNASVGGNHTHAVASRWVGNLGGWDCVPGMAYRHNVGKRCGPSDRRVSETLDAHVLVSFVFARRTVSGTAPSRRTTPRMRPDSGFALIVWDEGAAPCSAVSLPPPHALAAASTTARMEARSRITLPRVESAPARGF